TKKTVRFLAVVARLSALPLLVGVTGCAGDRLNEGAGHSMDDASTAQRKSAETSDLRMEDARTAERAREALAAGFDYRYEGVKVTTRDGVVQLDGFVNSTAHKITAEAITRRATGA